MKRFLLIAAAAVASPALAQTDAAPSAPDSAVASAPAPLDPDRIAAAHAVVDHIFPTGTYARIMNGTMDSVMKTVMSGVGDMPVRDLARIGGIPEERLKNMGPGSLNEMMAIVDPAYRQRMEAMTTAMMGEMTKLMTTFEPEVREGLTNAYARRFTPAQLADLNRFFETPTGSIYASESMMLFMDPEVMNRMMKMVPELTKQMPAMIGVVQAATASFPKPKEYDDLSKAERTRLANLLGISEAELAKSNRNRKKN